MKIEIGRVERCTILGLSSLKFLYIIVVCLKVIVMGFEDLNLCTSGLSVGFASDF